LIKINNNINYYLINRRRTSIIEIIR